MELKQHPLGEFTDADGTSWAVSLEVGGSHAEPTLLLQCEGMLRTERYYLRQFQSIAGRCSDFLIAAMVLGDPEFTIGASTVNSIYHQAIGRLSRLDGHYEICWVPNDPSLPF